MQGVLGGVQASGMRYKAQQDRYAGQEPLHAARSHHGFESLLLGWSLGDAENAVDGRVRRDLWQERWYGVHGVCAGTGSSWPAEYAARHLVLCPPSC